LRVVLVALLTATVLGCTGGSDSSSDASRQGSPVTLTAIQITPANPHVTVGGSRQFTATGSYSDGSSQDVTTQASWSSSVSGVATVSSTGLANAIAAGTTTVTALLNGLSAFTQLVVDPASAATVTSVVVTPASPTLAVNATQQFTATANYSDGSSQNVTSQANWNSSAPSVATIGATTGLATAKAAGSTTISATFGGKTGNATLTVQPPTVTSIVVTPANSTLIVNATQQFTATANYSDGSSQIVTGQATWGSSQVAFATITTGGLATAKAAGTTTISATFGGKTGNATLTVQAAPPPTVSGVQVSPSSAKVAVNAAQQFTATALYSDGSSQNVTSQAVWASSDTSVATINATGLATAKATGTTIITADFGGKTGSTTLTVDGLALQGTGVLRVHPTNKRYFTNNSGKAILLTGSHTWTNFQDSGLTDPPTELNYTAYLNWMRGYNHNFFRLWSWEQAKWTAETVNDYWFTPMPYQRTGSGTALDGKPKFNLNQFNQTYFDRMRSRVQQAGDQGMYVTIVLFNGWSINTKDLGKENPWRGHPFNGANNVNSISGDANGDGVGNEIHTLAIPAVTAIQEAYVKKVIDTVNDLDNVFYEISNESDGGTAERDWQYHMINLIKTYEATKPRQHVVGMTALWPNGSDTYLYNSPADWISPRDGGSSTGIQNPTPADGRKVVLSDTDHICGICGDPQWVWKSFTRGQHPIFMDVYDGSGVGVGAGGENPNDPNWIGIRRNMGQVLTYAVKMNLAAMTPQGGLASSGYCLANAAASGAEYLVYVPNGGSVTVNLTATGGTLSVEWFRPSDGTTTAGSPVAGGASRSLSPPFSGEAVLYLRN
jgi:uncharacterized protein YjdB